MEGSEEVDEARRFGLVLSSPPPGLPMVAARVGECSSSGKRTAQRKNVAAWCCRYCILERDAADLEGKALDSRAWIAGRSVGITLRKNRLSVLLTGETLMVGLVVRGVVLW